MSEEVDKEKYLKLMEALKPDHPLSPAKLEMAQAGADFILQKLKEKSRLRDIFQIERVLTEEEKALKTLGEEVEEAIKEPNDE